MTDQTQQAATEQESPRLTLQDIANALQIIDGASQRGAFQGGELSSVGATRDNLARYVEFHRQQQEQQDEQSKEKETETKA